MKPKSLQTLHCAAFSTDLDDCIRSNSVETSLLTPQSIWVLCAHFIPPTRIFVQTVENRNTLLLKITCCKMNFLVVIKTAAKLIPTTRHIHHLFAYLHNPTIHLNIWSRLLNKNQTLIISLLLMQAFGVHINKSFANSWWFLYTIINSWFLVSPQEKV